MCVFCKIIKREIEKNPEEIFFEDDDLMAFDDLHPLAPVHILIIPKRHIESINDLKKEDALLIGKMILTGKDIAEKKGISEGGYKLLFRTGRDGGQEISHIHLHLIGGAPLYEEIRPI
jgi:histidine triad (HIT) family protein